MERSRRALEDGEHGPSLASDPQKLQLQKKSEDLRSQIASSKTENASALQNQLAAVESRLQKLETEGKFAQTIIQSYEPQRLPHPCCARLPRAHYRTEIALCWDDEQRRA